MKFLLPILMGLAVKVISQPITLDYIFQEPQIINPRPFLKQINPYSNKVYYYADEDYDGRLNMFDYDFDSGETYKYTDTGESASEFVVLKNGDCLSIIGGDLYISKNFTSSRTFTKDIQVNSTDGYEYSPLVRGNNIVYRRGGNYYLTKYDTTGRKYNEVSLTKDESDSISYQILAIEETPASLNTALRILFARYNESKEEEFSFPDYSGEYVRTKKNKKGIPEINLTEMAISKAGGDSIYVSSVNEVKYPSTERLLTIYADYSPAANQLVLDAEKVDRHTRKLYMYNTLQKSISEIYTESDNAWFERHDNPTMFTNEDAIVFSSEKSGYNNLYRLNADGTGLKQIAGGKFTINESVVDIVNQKIFFTANAAEPYEYFIYETDFEGTASKQLTSDKGEYFELNISPNGKYLFFKHSYINKPEELYYLNLSNYSETRVTNTISDKFTSVEWKIPEVITYANEEDGTTIYALVYKPDDFRTGKKYPLICFAHGDGYLQNVTYGFSHYADNFMVNTFFTQQGFVVLDVDFRGSKGYGKEFRNKTYQELGKWELSDYISGINYLSKLGFIDMNRVGFYGGSYGGFLSLMAAFNHSDVFKSVAALRAVSNWKYYYFSNKRYTIPRLGDYEEPSNRIYYEISSPITYADKLQIPLLLIHGMLDDNVFFQDMVLLTQKLIELGKDFELMIYPKESHSFYLQSSWLDSYKRIYRFFEKNLK